MAQHRRTCRPPTQPQQKPRALACALRQRSRSSTRERAFRTETSCWLLLSGAIGSGSLAPRAAPVIVHSPVSHGHYHTRLVSDMPEFVGLGKCRDAPERPPASG
jgi:hypothetical protein